MPEIEADAGKRHAGHLGTMPGSEGRLVARRYRLHQPVGRGGMGMVWQAHDEILDRPVAVKELLLSVHLDEAGRAAAQRRMLREARSAARLSHPSIVTVHDVVEEDDRPWIVMELLRARSLDQVVHEEGPLPVRRVAEIGRHILDGLRHAHAAGVLHRDVKPGNVLITADRIVLTDFGIAVIEGDVTSTNTGWVMGSPAYVPPERLQGRPITPAADLWSIGATLYAAVEGRPPYEGPDAMAVLGAIVTQDPAPPRRAGALLPVIHGLMRKDPATRMSAAQVAELLERVLRKAAPGPELHAAPTPEDLPPLNIPSGIVPWKTIETPSGPIQVSLLDALDSPSGPLTPPPADTGAPEPGPPAAGPDPGSDPETTPTSFIPDIPPRPAGGARIEPIGPPPGAPPLGSPPLGAPEPPPAEPIPPRDPRPAARRAEPARSRPGPRPRWIRNGRPTALLLGTVIGTVAIALLAWILTPSGVTTPVASTPTPSKVAPIEVPAGYELREDTGGMKYAVPEDAQRTTGTNDFVTYTSKKYDAVIEVEPVARADDGGEAALASEARENSFENYRQIRLTKVPSQWPSTEWEYAYKTLDGTAQHGLKRYISCHDSGGVTMTITTPEKAWKGISEVRKVLFSTFRPPKR